MEEWLDLTEKLKKSLDCSENLFKKQQIEFVKIEHIQNYEDGATVHIQIKNVPQKFIDFAKKTDDKYSDNNFFVKVGIKNNVFFLQQVSDDYPCSNDDYDYKTIIHYMDAENNAFCHFLYKMKREEYKSFMAQIRKVFLRKWFSEYISKS